METYIDRIKKIKSEKKLTNDQLAALSGIPLGTLSKVLAGMNDSPKLSTLLSICRALDCSLEYIVTGEPENTNNYTLSAKEIEMMESYRRLDVWGRDLVSIMIAKESERCFGEAASPLWQPENALAKTPQKRYPAKPIRTGRRTIQLYELPVSAGVGVYLEEARSEEIKIPNTDKTAEADYALRISGNSMEPKFRDGDVLLIQNADAVENGELGIFLLDGNGFFKVFAGDRLLSLNPAYGPILLKDYSDIQCKGRVVGKLKRK